MDSNDTIENLSSINQDLFEEYEHLLSLCWDSATLSATFYVMQTMEMFIVPEITDLRPMFSYTHNLFRQLNPIAVMASGHESFLREIMNLLKFPESACAKDYSVNVVLNNPDMNKFVVFPQSEKSFPENHRRLFNVNVAGFENESEKKTYLNTNIPLHQKLVIQSAGNLLRYMEANWKSISPDNAKPIISSLKVFSLKSQVLIDDSSYLALEIFNTAPHPSGFMKGIKGTEQIGFSLYRLLNHCQSKVGCDELKMIFQQPTNDIAVLRKRYDTIEWCLDPRNADTVGQLRKVLRHVYEISRCFKKILEKPDKMYFWKIFRTSITNAFRVCELCRDSTEPEQNCGIVGDLRDAIECQVDIMVVFMAINEIIDIDEGMEQNKFITLEGFDAELDAMKAILRAAQVSVPDETKDIIRSIFPVYESCEFTLVPEMGFVVAIKSPMITPVSSDSSSTATSKSGVKFICHTKETYYYTTPSCRELNDKYGAIYNDICMREQQICTDLIAFITKNLPKLLGIIKSCAQLDCFIAMATVSGKRMYVRPQMHAEKGLNIVNGRHALMEECKTVIPNDVHISPSTGNLITIITAPNSAGKSIYLKQVGIIVYLAHIGCYVPAASAEIGTVNAIYSRIHSSDAVHQEISSFLYDLHQMANIIANSTERSLILIDEFGSGTTVNEGKSLLVACIEDLSRRGAFAPIAIFSTHYLDTVDLCEVREMLKEITIESHFDDSGKLQTTYKIIDGRYPQQNANELHNIRSSVKNLDTLTDERLKSILEKMNSSSSAPPDSDALLREKLHCAYSTLMTYLDTNADIQATIDKFKSFDFF
ncbi:mutS protein homolog 5-like [Lutzomyia longipalpis]|uniref:mutS protein homolog 5-like n=1 Tax=Lutzomyia longipalpis TaxID=7200 RepID=UPI002483F5D6|nr:mutS protein homolog 5-like [Lutzomyia longipalpis]